MVDTIINNTNVYIILRWDGETKVFITNLVNVFPRT